jgi:hypothetical protein
MREKLRQLLDQQQLTFHSLAYAHCKKNPKALGTVQAVPWAEVDQALGEILAEQIRQLLVRESDEDCYVGHYTGEPVCVDSVCPPGYPDSLRSRPLVTLLNQVSGGSLHSHLPQVNPDPELQVSPVAAYGTAIQLIALKYLAQERSQTAVVCLIDFTAELPTGSQRFAFLTVVDLDERRVEAVINEHGHLTAQVLINVFKEKGLSKGALYPYLPDVTQAEFDPTALYIHQEQSVGDYWPKALECRRTKHAVAAERVGLFTVLHEVKPLVEPSIFNDLARETALHPTVGIEEFAKVIGVSVEEAKPSWRRAFGSERYTVSGQAALGPRVKAYHVTAGSLSIPEVRADLLAQLRQVTHNGQRYLVIPLDEPVKVVPARRKPREQEQVVLPEISLDRLIEEITNRQ